MKTIAELGVDWLDFPPVFSSVIFGTGNGEEFEPKNTLLDFFKYRFADRVTRYDDRVYFLDDLRLLASRFIAAKEASADIIDAAGHSTITSENFTAPEGTPIFTGGAIPANSLGGSLTKSKGETGIDTGTKMRLLRFALDTVDDALNFFEPLFTGVYLV